MATACEQISGNLSVGERLIEPNDEFRAKFDKASFAFHHRLADHPAFSLRRLVDLAQETQLAGPADLYYDAGKVDVNQRWDETARPEFSAADAIRRIEHCGAWIVLKRADKNPEYAAVLRQCMAELQDLTHLNLNRVMKLQEVILFITSPQRVTTYHIDRECSLLLQIKGDKTLYSYDKNDRVVIPDRSEERRVGEES